MPDLNESTIEAKVAEELEAEEVESVTATTESSDEEVTMEEVVTEDKPENEGWDNISLEEYNKLQEEKETSESTEEDTPTNEEVEMPGIDWDEPQPVLIGSPRPTDELNPELAAMEKERRERQAAEAAESGIEIPFNGLFGNSPDYGPLFESYKNIIEALDQNINYVKHRTEVVNRKLWIPTIISIAALILAIVK